MSSMLIKAWNIRGLNSPLKQKEVSSFLSRNSLGVFGLLETHVKYNKAASIALSISSHLRWWGNYDHCGDGRIWIFWNENQVDLEIVSSSSQFAHCLIHLKSSRKILFVTFVYGYNLGVQRRPLWNDLISISDSISGPWLCLGDFNTILYSSERISAANPNLQDIREFVNCLHLSGLSDIQFQGPNFTWTNRQDLGERVWSKLDRILSNCDFLAQFPSAAAQFTDNYTSDHCQATVILFQQVAQRQKPFRFLNSWCLDSYFMQMVSDVWRTDIFGCRMFILIYKLKLLKVKLKHWHKRNFSFLDSRINSIENQLVSISIDTQNLNAPPGVFSQEKDLLQKLKHLKQAKYFDLQQRCKLDYIRCNDDNNKYFYAKLVEKRAANAIHSITDCEGVYHDKPEAVATAFVRFYQNLLGTSQTANFVDTSVLQAGAVLSATHSSMLTAHVTYEEIRTAVFSMHSDKSPGPDGFSPGFFKNAWSIIKDDFCMAITEFFESGKLLSEVNSTFITLIPKSTGASHVGDYRPISLCNVIYKTITKIMANRLKLVINDVIGIEQGAFIHGREISDNILLAHELVKHYDRKWISPRICIKVDLRKAFDSASWDFLHCTLLYFGFPSRFVDWIMTCISSPSFSVILNGSPYGYFPGKRGLRQGDPLSPLLFVLIMEMLSRLLRQMTGPFRFHPYCASLKLTHLIFADDLLIFCRGDLDSVLAVKSCLDTFATWSGLHANPAKTGIYFGGVPVANVDNILENTGFRKEAFPFRYLGIPLNASRLTVSICAPLLDSIAAKIHHWSTHFLSYAGRLQLINSVIFGILNFWCTPFLLPATILKEIDKMCRRFFWNYEVNNRRMVFFSWHNICKPKAEGGLNIKETLSWNKSLACKLIHKLLIRKGIWAIWATNYYLISTKFWNVIKCHSDTWSWKNLLSTRDSIIAKAGSLTEAARLFHTWCSAGKFLISRAYDFLRTRRPVVFWHPVAWNMAAIPKHSVILTLAAQNSLPTYDNIMCRGFFGPSRCILCGAHEETVAHLYFSCPFSRSILSAIKTWVKFMHNSYNLKQILWHLKRHYAKDKWRISLAQCAINASVYFIWLERNARLFANNFSSPQVLIRKIQFVTSVRMLHIPDARSEDARLDYLLL